jgi:hypothetical protein
MKMPPLSKRVRFGCLLFSRFRDPFRHVRRTMARYRCYGVWFSFGFQAGAGVIAKSRKGEIAKVREDEESTFQETRAFRILAFFALSLFRVFAIHSVMSGERWRGIAATVSDCHLVSKLELG